MSMRSTTAGAPPWRATCSTTSCGRRSSATASGTRRGRSARRSSAPEGRPARTSPSAARRVARRDEEHDAAPGGVGREERRHLVVEEGEARGAEPERVGREVDAAAGDGGLELGRAVAAVAEAAEHLVEVDEPEEIDGGIGREVLVEAEMAGRAAEVARAQPLE